MHKKTKGVSERRKTWLNCRKCFIKNRRNGTHSTPHTTPSLFRTFKTYSFNFNGGLCNLLCEADSEPVSWAVSVIFFKSILCDLTIFGSNQNNTALVWTQLYVFMSEELMWLIETNDPIRHMVKSMAEERQRMMYDGGKWTWTSKMATRIREDNFKNVPNSAHEILPGLDINMFFNKRLNQVVHDLT